MHIIMERDALAEAVSFVERRARKNTISILNHIKVVAADGIVTITGHDLDSSSECEFPVEIKTHGSCAVPTNTFAPLIKGMPKGSHVSMRLERTDLHIEYNRSKYKLPVLPAADFPSVLSAGDTPKITVDPDSLEQMFVIPPSVILSTEERPYYQGVFLHCVGDKLASASCDGHRFLVTETDIETGPLPAIIVPRYAVEEIVRLAGGEDIVLAWSDRILTASAGHKAFSARLISATFPDYAKFIPNAEGPCLEFARDGFIAALSRLTAISDEKNPLILEWGANPKELTASLQSLATGYEHLSCKGSGVSAGHIAIPVVQFLGLVKAIPADKLRLYITDHMHPLRISDPDNPRLIACQVPCYSGRTMRTAA